jgi:hypothetical protein
MKTSNSPGGDAVEFANAPLGAINPLYRAAVDRNSRNFLQRRLAPP